MSVVISCFAIWLILVKNLFGRFLSIQRSAKPESPNAVRKPYYSITAYYSDITALQHITKYYSNSVAPAVRIQNILTTVTIYDFCYFRYFQLSFYLPPHPLPLKTSDLHESRVNIMTVGGGGRGNCPQLPPPPTVATLMWAPNISKGLTNSVEKIQQRFKQRLFPIRMQTKL